VLPGAARGRAALALVPRPVDRRPVRVLRGRGEPEDAQLPDLHAGPERDRQVRDVGQFQRDVAGEAGVDEPGRRVGEQTEPAQAGLAFQASGELVAERHHFERRREYELARVQHEGFAVAYLDRGRQVVLLDRLIDVRVQVVVEDAEPAVEAYV